MKNLKVSVLLWGISMPFFAMAQNLNYTINGKIGELTRPAKAYMFIGDELDSAHITNGKFTFHGAVEEPRGAILVINKKGTGVLAGQFEGTPFPLYFYLEQGKIAITSPDSINNAKVKAGALNADYVKLKAQLRSTDTSLAQLAKKITAPGTVSNQPDTMAGYIHEQLSLIGKQQKTVFLNFMKNNPNSLMSLYVLRCYGGFDYSMLRNNNPVTPGLNELDSIFNTLSPAVRSAKPGTDFQNMIARLMKTGIGSMAMNFSQPDTLGKLVSLADFKGKYVLVDFWASWCQPCRADNPAVVRTFKKYADKNFTVLGVSLDNYGAKAAWLKAIHDDALSWTQVSDLKGWKNEAARLYGITSIPQNFLVDPNGKIIAKNLRGEELEKTLDTLFAQTVKYTLKGKVSNWSSPAKAFLISSQKTTVQVDSTLIQDGLFGFQGTALSAGSQPYLVVTKSGNRMASTDVRNCRFYTDAELISVVFDDSLTNVTVEGGELNRDEAALNAALAPIEAKIKAATALYERASKVEKKRPGFTQSFDEKIDAFEKEKIPVYLEFAKTHPNSLISLKALMALTRHNSDVATVEGPFNSLSPAVRSTDEGKEYAAKINEWKKIAIGKDAPDFTLYDTTGKAVSLREFKGKYLLLDFWASWCPPCRAESPFITEAFATYKNRNFTVLGVSLDNPDKKAAWIKAIKDDRLTWTQVSSLKMYDNEAANLYSVTSIPRNFLIGPDGKIIAKDLRGKALMQKLKEVLGE